MEIKLEVPVYAKETGLPLYWEEGFEISIIGLKQATSIRANKTGLISLDVQLLTLSQDSVPTGCHYHLDESNSLQGGSND